MEKKDGSSEPLLPVCHDTPPSRTPVNYTRSPHVNARSDYSSKSPKRMRDKYVKQLGYTPLIFQVRACVRA